MKKMIWNLAVVVFGLMTVSSVQATTSGSESDSINFKIDGKKDISLQLGQSYHFEISGAPANTKLLGHCEGPSRCQDWFFYSMNAKTDESGKFIYPGLLAPNWNIPLTTYQFWISTEDGKLKSNKVSMRLGPKAAKPQIVTSGLQLRVNERLIVRMEIGLGVIYSIDGGTADLELLAHCQGPMKPCDASWFFPGGKVKLDGKGTSEISSAIGIGSPVPAGRYALWLATDDGKIKSNKIVLKVKPSRTKNSHASKE